MKYVYYGERYYSESGTMLGVLYTEDGTRGDWGKVSYHLRQGDEVHIRPATFAEMARMDVELARYRRERAERDAARESKSLQHEGTR